MLLARSSYKLERDDDAPAVLAHRVGGGPASATSPRSSSLRLRSSLSLLSRSLPLLFLRHLIFSNFRSRLHVWPHSRLLGSGPDPPSLHRPRLSYPFFSHSYQDSALRSSLTTIPCIYLLCFTPSAFDTRQPWLYLLSQHRAITRRKSTHHPHFLSRIG